MLHGLLHKASGRVCVGERVPKRSVDHEYLLLELQHARHSRRGGVQGWPSFAIPPTQRKSLYKMNVAQARCRSEHRLPLPLAISGSNPRVLRISDSIEKGIFQSILAARITSSHSML